MHPGTVLGSISKRGCRVIFPRAVAELGYPVHWRMEAPFSGATNGVIGSARDIETEFNGGGAGRFVTAITAS